MTEPKSRVLVVDDDSTHRKLMELISDHLGVQAEVVGNCAEAIEALSHTTFDVILMDWRMAEVDGEACTRKLRLLSSSKSTPIIAVTALAMPGDREACLRGGVDDYLSKPFTIEGLRELIKKWSNPEVRVETSKSQD